MQSTPESVYLANVYYSLTGNGSFEGLETQVSVNGGGTQEITEPSASGEGTSAALPVTPATEKCPICGFCPIPLGLCIFIWIAIAIAIIIIILLLTRKKKCPQCGAKLKKNANRCTQCGAVIKKK